MKKREIRRAKIFKYIQENSPTSIYKISRVFEVPYSTIYTDVLELLRGGLVKERIIIGENNLAIRELSAINLEKGEDEM